MSRRLTLSLLALLAAAGACGPKETPEPKGKMVAPPGVADTTPAASDAPLVPETNGAGTTEATPLVTTPPVTTPPAGTPPVATPPAGTPPTGPTPAAFTYDPPGKLVAGSGGGATDQTIWAPNMRFPMEMGPAFANSQVWGVGGGSGPAGAGQCDTRNYSYPWHDNFCETRPAYKNMFCRNGSGHQGQDIRPATCKKAVHTVLAAEDGVITAIQSYTVFLTADSGRLFRYLHMDMATTRALLHEGQRVKRGQKIGVVSNDFKGTPTTIHLHMEIKAPVTRDGVTVFTFVPPYTSLLQAYQRLLSAGPSGA